LVRGVLLWKHIRKEHLLLCGRTVYGIDALEQSCLTNSVWSENCQEFVRFRIEADSVENPVTVVTECELFDGQYRRCPSRIISQRNAGAARKAVRTEKA